MCTVGDLIETLSKMLNDHEPDHEYKRWCKPLLKRYLSSAIAIAAASNRQHFTEQKEIELSSGCYHCVDGCEEIVSVMSIGSDDCSMIEQTSEKYNGISSLYHRQCLNAEEQEDDSFSYGPVKIQSETKRCFTTERPVEQGTLAKILCFKSPDVLNMDESEELPAAVCGNLFGVITQLAMAQARTMDSESEAGIAASNQHLSIANSFAALGAINNADG